MDRFEKWFWNFAYEYPNIATVSIFSLMVGALLLLARF